MQDDVVDRFTVLLNQEQAEYIRDYRYHMIQSGRIDYTLAEAFRDFVESFRNEHPVPSRPDYVKQNEFIKRKKRYNKKFDTLK